MHIVFYKRKVIIDQLRKGLVVLGLLKEISRYPEFYTHFFVGTNRFFSSRSDCEDRIPKVRLTESRRPTYSRLYRNVH